MEFSPHTTSISCPWLVQLRLNLSFLQSIAGAINFSPAQRSTAPVRRQDHGDRRSMWACPRIVAILIAGIISLSATSLAADSYRWKDKDGKVHYGAAVPAEYADQPYDILNNQGIVIERVEDTSVPLEAIAEEKIKKERAPLISEEQRRYQADRLLLIRYSSAEEIAQAMEVEIAQLGYDKKVVTQSFDSTTGAIRNQIRQAADRQRAGLPISAEQQKEIDELYARQARDSEKLSVMSNRENRIRTRFNADIERYNFLHTDAGTETLSQKPPTQG